MFSNLWFIITCRNKKLLKLLKPFNTRRFKVLIVGAKGFAKEILQHFHNEDQLKDIVFYDYIRVYLSYILFNKFKVLRNIEEAKTYFETISNKYVIGVGTPKSRFLLKNKKMDSVGGTIDRVIVYNVEVGPYGVNIGKGVNITSNTIIINYKTIGDCTLINLNCTIGHDSIIGNFCELSLGSYIYGHVKLMILLQ